MRLIPDIIAPVSASTASLLGILQRELSISAGAYEGRRFDADHIALKRAKVQARLRFRGFLLSAMHGG